MPLEQATTSSLEALRVYSQGRQAFSKSDFPSAISSFQHAVDLDPNFATAYFSLGVSYSLIEDVGLELKNIQRAYDLRNRTSEYEMLAISAGYDFFVTRDLERAAKLYERLAKTYPRDPNVWSTIGVTACQLGRYGQATAALLEALRLNPESQPYGWLSGTYVAQNRFEEARATIREARARKIEPSGAFSVLYILDFLQNDQAGMTEQLSHPWTDQPAGNWEDTQGITAAYYGHLSNARDWTRRAIASAASLHLNALAAYYRLESALREAVFGNFGEARKDAKEANRKIRDPDGQGTVVLALALAGDFGQAQKLADDLNQRFPEATFVPFVYLPMFRATLAIRQGNAQKAIESLGEATSYELSDTGPGPMIPSYLRGQVYLAAHEGGEAAAEFQKILDDRGLVANAPIGALAHLGLGRAYVLEGDTAKAHAAYQDFLTLWKDADPDIPILKEAKAEYARLQ